MKRLVSAVFLFGAFLFAAGCVSNEPAVQTEDEAPRSLDYDGADDSASSGGWYNAPVLRAIFGDFGPADELVIDERRMPEYLERGRYVVTSLAACGSCHGKDPVNPDSPLSGGRSMEDRFGSVNAPNITPDARTGIGAWSYAEVARAVRASIDRRGKPLSLDLHAGYRWMSDRDAKAVAVYLKKQKAVRNVVERRELGGFERNAWGLFPQHEELKGYVPVMPDNWPVPYGRHLASEISRCQSCHTEGGSLGSGEPFAGAPDRGQPVFSMITGSAEPAERGPFPVIGPDIRGREGLAEWSVQQIVNYLQTGRGPQGKRSDPALCPWRYFSRMTEHDQKAIAEFLKTF